jgi:hypothetical protein
MGTPVKLGDTIVFAYCGGSAFDFKKHIVDYIFEWGSGGSWMKKIISSTGEELIIDQNVVFFKYDSTHREFIEYKGLVADYDEWAKIDGKLKKC